jgi:hypothetical protein
MEGARRGLRHAACIGIREKLKEIDGEAGEKVVEGLKDVSPDLAGFLIEFS